MQQEANIEMFREYAPSILLRQCLLAFRRNNRTNQYHRAMINRCRVEKKAKFYEAWRNGYLVEKAKVDFFNKTVICIKNNIAKRAFKTLALNALKGRLKKRSDVHRYQCILSKVLKSFRLAVERRDRLNLLQEHLSGVHK